MTWYGIQSFQNASMDFNEITVTHTQAKLVDEQDRAQCTPNTPHKWYCKQQVQ